MTIPSTCTTASVVCPFPFYPLQAVSSVHELPPIVRHCSGVGATIAVMVIPRLCSVGYGFLYTGDRCPGIHDTRQFCDFWQTSIPVPDSSSNFVGSLYPNPERGYTVKKYPITGTVSGKPSMPYSTSSVIPARVSYQYPTVLEILSNFHTVTGCFCGLFGEFHTRQAVPCREQP